MRAQHHGCHEEIFFSVSVGLCSSVPNCTVGSLMASHTRLNLPEQLLALQEGSAETGSVATKTFNPAFSCHLHTSQSIAT